MKRITSLILSAACLFLNCCAERSSPLSTGIVTIGDARIVVEIADTPEKCKKGYMYRAPPGRLEGMLFVFEGEAERSFWNRNVTFSIDIAFLASNGRVVCVNRMKALDETSVFSGVPARYALEMRAGAFKRLGVSAGTFVKLFPEIAEIK